MLDPIRVALVHWTCAPTTGGVESHLAELADGLAEAGCVVTLITGEPHPVVSERYETVSSPLLELEVIQRGASPERSELRRQLRHILKEGGIKVVHGHNLHHFSPEPALTLHELRDELRFRLFHTFHETWPDLLTETPVYRGWDRNFAVSSFVREQCRLRLGFEPELFPLGVNPARFQPLRASFCNSTATILHPARLLPWKGVHLSVGMLGQLRSEGRDVRLIITDTQRIADWNVELASYRTQILRQIASLGLEPLVELRAACYHEMPALYNTADLVVYPTVGEEPFGLVPLEAMSCERAVVAARSGGIAETVVNGRTGFTIPRGDEHALARAVGHLLDHPRTASRFGEAGRQHVLRNFDAREYVARLVGRYESAGPS